MAVQSVTKTIATAGGAGTATGSAVFNSISPSRLLAIFFDYSATTPATADVTLSSKGAVIVTRTNSATDAWVFPRTNASDGAGTAITASFVPFVLAGNIQVDVAQSNPSESVTVTLVVDV